MRTGAAGVIVGYGAGSTTTTNAVLGIDVPMATAIADAAAARRSYLDETGGRYVHVIADGDLQTSADVVKAIACGADAVMLGEQLTAAEEVPGQGFYWVSAAAHPQLPRGHVSLLRRRRRPAGDPAARAGLDHPGRHQHLRRAAPGHGQDRLLRPQGVPEGRSSASAAELRRLAVVASLIRVSERDCLRLLYGRGQRRSGDQAADRVILDR